MKPRLDIHGERERPGDCSVWSLPVGIRKSDGPVWSSSVGRDGQYVQCKRESFGGGSQRGYGDGVKEKRSLGKLSDLPASHPEFSDLLKEGKHPPPKKVKKQNPKPHFGHSTRNKSKAADSAENGNA